jgi:hypothetical protein
VGFSPCGNSFSAPDQIMAFFRSLFSPYINSAKLSRAVPFFLRAKATGFARNIHACPPGDKIASSRRVGIRAYATQSPLEIDSHSSRPKK